MFICDDPDRTVTTIEHIRCFIHQQLGHPPRDPEDWRPCGCTLRQTTREATPEEYRANRTKRLTAEKEHLEHQLRHVEYQLSQIAPPASPSPSPVPEVASEPTDLCPGSGKPHDWIWEPLFPGEPARKATCRTCGVGFIFPSGECEIPPVDYEYATAILAIRNKRETGFPTIGDSWPELIAPPLPPATKTNQAPAGGATMSTGEQP